MIHRIIRNDETICFIESKGLTDKQVEHFIYAWFDSPGFMTLEDYIEDKLYGNYIRIILVNEIWL